MPDQTQPTLQSLADRFKSDKAAHGYCAFYEDLFAPRRNDDLRILELGVGGFDMPDDPSHGGASLRVWKGYFPKAEIWGLDLLDKHSLAEERIHIIQGSQTDRTLLEELVNSEGPFDIIVDDASHIPSLTLMSFEVLYPLLAPSGIYVIEDLSTSYWPMWGGRFRRRARGTTMSFIKDRLDGLNHAELKLPNIRASELDTSIIEVRARHNIAAFIKGDNTIPSDLNRPNPVTMNEWFKSDVLPAAARSAQRPVVLRTLDLLRVRPLAARVRQRLVPKPQR